MVFIKLVAQEKHIYLKVYGFLANDRAVTEFAVTETEKTPEFCTKASNEQLYLHQ